MALYKYKSAIRMLLESDLQEFDLMCSIQIYSLSFILDLSDYRAHSLGCRLCESHAYWLAL